MRLPQTKKLMTWLRERSKIIRPNNLRISEWVDDYIDRCILEGRVVDILTQWCLSKDLETRYQTQGNRFGPLQAERDMFRKSIPEILDLFRKNGVSVNWYITFNDSFLDVGRVENEVAVAYMDMIQSLSDESGPSPELILLNWEKDVLGKKSGPSQEVLANFQDLVPQQAFEIDFRNLLERVRRYPDFKKTNAELLEESRLRISCEAEEGRFLFSSESPFINGEFILTPLEFPERYVFFEILSPGFQKRIVSVLKLYPWRMDAETLMYKDSL